MINVMNCCVQKKKYVGYSELKSGEDLRFLSIADARHP